LRTEEAYVGWIRRFILFHQKRHPQTLGTPEVEAFLTDLAVNQHVAASTQNQALSALLFLYSTVLEQPLTGPLTSVRAKQPQRLPTVLTREEVRRVLDALAGVHQVMAQLLYGSGLRLMECVRLRVKDLDFAQRQLIVREGKGAKDRLTMLPDRMLAPLQTQLQYVKLLHEQDLRAGCGMKEALDGAIAATRPGPAREAQHGDPPRDRQHRQDNAAQLSNRGHAEFTGQAAEQW